jgi:hypothetical protein
MLPIETSDKGRPEIHHTRNHRMMLRWQADGSIERIFSGTVHKLHQDRLLDLPVTATARRLQRKAATTSGIADTSISRVARSSPSAIATTTSSRRS